MQKTKIKATRKEIQKNRDKQQGAEESIFKKLFMTSERWRVSEGTLQAKENWQR